MTSQVQVCGDGEWERKRSDEQLIPKEERWAQGRGVSRCLERVRHRLGDVRVVPQTSSKRAQHCFLWQVILFIADKMYYTRKLYVKCSSMHVVVIMDTDSGLRAMLSASLTSRNEQGLGIGAWAEIPSLPPTAVWLCGVCKNAHPPSV